MSALTQLRLQLLANGFDPLPARGKAVYLDEWQTKTNTTPEEIASWERHTDWRNSGINGASVGGLDIDIADPAAAEALRLEIDDWFAPQDRAVLRRTGNAPKFLVPFQANAPFPKMAQWFRAPNGAVHKMEFLRTGQQWIAFGYNPDAKRNYSWHNDQSPLTTTRDELPHLEEKAARELLEYLSDILVQKFDYVLIDGPERPKTNGQGETTETRRRFDRDERRAELHYPGNIHLYERDCTASLIASGVDLDDTVATALDDVRNYINSHPQKRPWNWDREMRRIRRMSYSWVNKHAEFSATLPAAIVVEYSRIENAGGTPWLFWDRSRKDWWVKSKTPISVEDTARARAATGWRYYDTATPEPMKWSIKGILIERGLTILSGQWGTYKTTVALYLALSIMTGIPFAGRYRVKRRGGIICFAAEGAGGLDYRLKEIARSIEGPERLPFAYRPDCPPLKDFKSAAIINAYIDEAAAELRRTHDVDVVYAMFDTWSKTSGAEKKGEDDDAGVTAAVIKTLDAVGAHTQCGLLAIDHMGKDVERGTRGSSGKEAIEGLLATLGDRSIASPVTNTRLVVRKVKDGPAGFEVPFTPRKIKTGVDEDGDDVTAILLDWEEARDCAPKAPKEKKTSGAITLLLNCLEATIAAEGKQLARKSGPVMAAPKEKVRERFWASFVAKPDSTSEQVEEAKRQAWHRAITKNPAPVGSRTENGIEWIWKATGK